MREAGEGLESVALPSRIVSSLSLRLSALIPAFAFPERICDALGKID
jgi:hypothetical protein